MIFLLFSKRFFKRFTYLAILIAIPVLTLALRTVSAEEKGMLTIALVMPKQPDQVLQDIETDLLSTNSVIHYISCDGEEEARELLIRGKLDAVWSFVPEFASIMAQHAGGGYTEEPLVRIRQREESVYLQLAREALFGTIYPYYSYSVYSQFLQKNFGDQTAVKEQEIKIDFTKYRNPENLFRYSFYNEENVQEIDSSSYLLTPVRGILAILIFLSGMAATLYYLQDKERGLFAFVAAQKRWAVPYIYQFTAMFYVAAAAALSLVFTGLSGTWYQELLRMILYLFATAAFCNFMRRIAHSIQGFTACIPILVLLLFALCPVFFTIRSMRAIQNLLPTFHYLNSVHNPNAVCSLLLSGCILFGLDFLLSRFDKEK